MHSSNSDAGAEKEVPPEPEVEVIVETTPARIEPLVRTLTAAASFPMIRSRETNEEDEEGKESEEMPVSPLLPIAKFTPTTRKLPTTKRTTPAPTTTVMVRASSAVSTTKVRTHY